MDRVHVRVVGDVQGVGFRGYVRHQAVALGLHGWVANRADGAVEIEAEGPRAALERLLERVGHGPALAQVGSVETRWSDGPARHREFEIRRSP